MTKNYTRPEKAVIFLMTLDEGTVVQVLDRLEEPEIQKVANYMTKLEDMDTQIMDMVSKEFYDFLSNKIIKNFNFTLTNSQKRVIAEINNDLRSDYKMFRLLQGDVGSGKTIVSFVAAANVIRAGWQAALMAPTEILAKQHFDLALKIFNSFPPINQLQLKRSFREKKYIKIYKKYIILMI